VPPDYYQGRFLQFVQGVLEPIPTEIVPKVSIVWNSFDFVVVVVVVAAAAAAAAAAVVVLFIFRFQSILIP
jgi:hypothetical protein